MGVIHLLPEVLGKDLSPVKAKKSKPLWGKNAGRSKANQVYSDETVGWIKYLFDTAGWSAIQISERLEIQHKYVYRICVDGLRPNVKPVRPYWYA